MVALVFLWVWVLSASIHPVAAFGVFFLAQLPLSVMRTSKEA
jgi:hypothetical protein